MSNGTLWIELEIQNRNNWLAIVVARLILFFDEDAAIKWYTKNVYWRFVGEIEWKPI